MGMKERMPAWVSRLRPRLRDVVGVDLGSSGVKAVRLRCDALGKVTLLAADLLPAMRSPPEGGTPAPTLRLPKPLQARAAALCYSSPHAVCKLLTLPGGPEKAAETVYSDLLGLPRQTAFRCCHTLLDGESRNETQVLAVAVPESEGVWLTGLFDKGDQRLWPRRSPAWPRWEPTCTVPAPRRRAAIWWLTPERM